MLKNNASFVFKKGILLVLIALMLLSACSTQNTVLSENLTSDVKEYIRSFNRLLSADDERTACTDIVWNYSLPGEYLSVASIQPFWVYMTLLEKNAVNPFVLHNRILQSGLLREIDTSGKPVFRLSDYGGSPLDSALFPISSLSESTHYTEYSIENCEQILSFADISSPVYEADDCLYCYFGSCQGSERHMVYDVAAIYFFPDETRTSIERAEMQLVYGHFSPAMELYGGWAGSSTGSAIAQDYNLVRIASIIAALELYIAGETDILTHLASEGDGVPESYLPGNGESGMQAQLHMEYTSLGTLLEYSLSYK